jgi:hypothetical protein
MSTRKIVQSTWTPAFSRGPDGTITAWNRGAEKLFSVSAEEVVGRQCHEVMAGRDVFGNDYCCAECASWKIAGSDRLVHPYQLSVKSVGGRTINLRVSVFAVNTRRGAELVHLLEAVVGTGVFAGLTDEIDGEELEWGNTGCNLTKRELQVLQHLAVGYDAQEISRQLLISDATVRNHISRCLEKLEIHSRADDLTGGEPLEVV